MKSIHLEEKYSCEFCDYKFTAMSNLRHHVKDIHQQRRDIVSCTDCKRSLRKNNLARHKIYSCHSILEKKKKKKKGKGNISCTYCNKSMNKKNFARHRKHSCSSKNEETLTVLQNQIFLEHCGIIQP